MILINFHLIKILNEGFILVIKYFYIVVLVLLLM